MNNATLWATFKESQSSNVKKQIMVNYTNLVHYVIHNSKFMNLNVVEEKDYFQFGVEGLSEAIDRFDPDYGTKFETYAIQRIRGKIIDELRKLQIKPRNNNPENEIQYKNISLNNSFDSEDGFQLYEVIPSEQKLPDEIVQKTEQKDILIEMIGKLPERDRLIISLYYYENLNYKEIAEVLGITVSRVSQIHSKIIKEMKENFKLNTTDKVMEETKENKKRVSSILSTVYNLPAAPLIILEVSKLIEDPKSSAAQLGKLISKDQGLVTKILAVANSPLYGIPRRVSTIEFAIVILGFNHIKNIVVALSMMEAFKNIGDAKFNQKAYWEHSLLTATASKKIADDLGLRLSGEIFTAGLLHDLGIPIIYKYFNKEYNAIEKAMSYNTKILSDVEREILGVTHGELGEMLINKWNLPDKLGDSLKHHHKPSDAEVDKEIAAVVHLADYLTHKFQLGNIVWDNRFELDEGIIKILNLGDEKYLENLMETYQTLFENQLESIKL